MSGSDPVNAETEVPSTQREDVLRAVLADDETGSDPVRGSLPRGTVPPAAEWIDLADAGPYIDETKLPLFTPNGDGSGGQESSDNADTERWLQDALKRIAKHPVPEDD